MTRTASLKHAVCDSIPVKVVRSWEKSADGNGLIMRFKLTNTHKTALKIGKLPDIAGIRVAFFSRCQRQ